MPNALAKETSPYLLQHAHNPVNWFPWADVALQKAKTENKPIIVSIGYSACHWCHVMERESFENEQVAAIMNEHFVCIKVDREERPDVDAVYMDAVQAMGVRGGWPLNVFLLPDASPFYGGTYFPAQQWVNLCYGVRDAFDNKLNELRSSADAFVKDLNRKEFEKYQFGQAKSDVLVSPQDLTDAFEQSMYQFDAQKGGMDRAPKFPMPSIWLFTLRLAQLTGDERAKRYTLLTLDKMCLGGIYDQLGGGFSRYSTDEDWLLPHFEKMLYDNGQLLSLYAEALHSVKGESHARVTAYEQVLRQTVGWLKREMTSPEGGFYSALDADSEGEEGKFYVWKKSEIDTILENDSEKFCKLFDVSKNGNFKEEATGHSTGMSILNAEHFLNTEDRAFADLCFEKLFLVREKRIRPGLDDKILCSWNALMLKGLIDTYRVLGDEAILNLALKNAHFLAEKMSIRVTGEARGLFHSYKNGQASIVAYLEDYAATIAAYTALYEVCFDEKWLLEAKMLADYSIANFFDTTENFFYFTDSQATELIARKKEIFDNVVPASNSIMANALYKLGILLDNESYQNIAKTMLAQILPMLASQLPWLSNWGMLACHLSKPMAEVVIVGPDALAIRQQIDALYYPSKVMMGSIRSSDLGLLQGRKPKEGETKIFICYNKTCQLPTISVEIAMEILSEG